MANIRLIVGLGNPGDEYEDTRHNAGFWFVEALARALDLGGRVRFLGFVTEAEKLALLRRSWAEPQTFMNRSGISVAGLANFYKITPEEVLVAHDELDFLPGTVKMKQGGSAGGHNGLKDIQARLGSPNFWRLRLGIGHPRSLALNQEVVDFVLHRPSREHQAQIDEAIDKALGIVDLMVDGRTDVAVQKLHSA